MLLLSEADSLFPPTRTVVAIVSITEGLRLSLSMKVVVSRPMRFKNPLGRLYCGRIRLNVALVHDEYLPRGNGNACTDWWTDEWMEWSNESSEPTNAPTNQINKWMKLLHQADFVHSEHSALPIIRFIRLNFSFFCSPLRQYVILEVW